MSYCTMVKLAFWVGFVELLAGAVLILFAVENMAPFCLTIIIGIMLTIDAIATLVLAFYKQKNLKH